MSEWDGYDDWPDADEQLCLYTGEQCIGDPGFCEECPILLEREEASP